MSSKTIHLLKNIEVAHKQRWLGVKTYLAKRETTNILKKGLTKNKNYGILYSMGHLIFSVLDRKYRTHS